MRPLRRDVQMIFQDPYGSLNPRHTVGTIVGAPYRLQHIKTEHGTKAAVQDLLELVGLNPEHYNRYPARVLRRSAAAHRHRPRAGAAAQAHRRRRAGLRLDVSIQAQVINLLEDLQDEFGPDLRRHRPRPVGRAPHVRPGRGHVPRQARRDRRPRASSTSGRCTRTRVSLLSAVPVPDVERRTTARAHPPARRRAQPGQPADRPAASTRAAGRRRTICTTRGAAARRSSRPATRSPATSRRTHRHRRDDAQMTVRLSRQTLDRVPDSVRRPADRRAAGRHRPPRDRRVPPGASGRLHRGRRSGDRQRRVGHRRGHPAFGDGACSSSRRRTASTPCSSAARAPRRRASSGQSARCSTAAPTLPQSPRASLTLPCGSSR